MKSKHILLAIAVTMVWGLNFPISKLALRSFDPFILTGLRFLLASIPFVFFVKRPNIHFKYIVYYGAIFGVAMWGLINFGIEVGVPPGIASLIIQLSAFFTMGWGAILFRERLRTSQWIGAALALIGLFGILLTRNGSAEYAGILLVVLSALSWSIGNVIIKKCGVRDVFSFIIWASLIPPIPLFAISFLIHGDSPFISAANAMSGIVILSIIFQVYLATHFSYWGWNTLLREYPLSTVAPLSLMIPVFGIGSSMIIVGEKIAVNELMSIVIIIIALLIGLPKKRNILVRESV